MGAPCTASAGEAQADKSKAARATCCVAIVVARLSLFATGAASAGSARAGDAAAAASRSRRIEFDGLGCPEGKRKATMFNVIGAPHLHRWQAARYCKHIAARGR